MRAYLINPYSRTITEIDYPEGSDYTKIHELLSVPEHKVDVIDCARINDRGDGIYIDDEGLFKEPVVFFKVAGYHTPLCGCGLVLGCDVNGETQAPTVDLEWLRANVQMLTLIGVFAGQPIMIPTTLEAA